jgi:Protein of unknown function (DUF2971)
MSAKFVAEGTREQKQARIQAILKRTTMSRVERRRVAPQVIAQSSEELAATVQDAHRRQVEHAGVYSFAGDPKGVLMWSHYADNHEGICIQFEVAQDMETIGRTVPVEYDDKYPVVNWFVEFETSLEPISKLLEQHQNRCELYEAQEV